MSLSHPAGVSDFQRTHLDHLGRPLVVDGKLGPETDWAMDLETLSAARRAIVRTAQVHLGLEETPPHSNSDPGGFIRRWLLAAGAQPGDPWCAAYASHCIGTVRLASAQKLGLHFPPTSLPCAGDVMWFPTDGVHGHCGIVIGVGATEVMTIEGNCQDAVRCVRRDRNHVRFGQVLSDSTGTCPGIVPSVPLAPGGTR
jgi:hypothetical protein